MYKLTNRNFVYSAETVNLIILNENKLLVA